MTAAYLTRSLQCILVAGLSILTGCLGPRGDHGDFDVEEIRLDVSDSAAYLPELDGPLRPLSATPSGPMAGMAPMQPIAITFSKPMVPLGGDEDAEAGAMVIQPEVPGRLQWEGSQTLVYQPESDLPPATQFTVTVGAGLKALDGESLARPIRWTFDTPRPVLISSEPSDGEEYAAPIQAFDLAFNQGIRHESAARFIRLHQTRGAGIGRSIPISVTRGGDSSLVVRPRSALPRGTTYTLMVLPGLQPARGSLASADTGFVRFRTYDNLRLESVTGQRSEWEEPTQEIDPQRDVVLSFTTPVRFGDMRRSLRFTPAVAWPAGIEAQDDAVGATHTVRLPFEPETQYTATVSNLRDQFGQVLRQGSVTFRTGALSPSLGMPTGIVVVEATQRRHVPLRVTNIDAVSIGMLRLQQDQVIPMIRSYDPQHWYGDLPAGRRVATPATTRILRPNIRRNRPTIVPVGLDSLLAGGKGVVGIRVTSSQVREDYRRDYRAIALVTNLGITAKFSPHQNLFMVTDLRTARPVAGVALTVRDLQNRVRWRGKTDATGRAVSPGWARLRIPKPQPWQEPILFVFAEKEGDLAFTASVYQEGIEPYRFDIPYDWSPDAITTAGSVFTDRGLYRAGEVVNLKGILRRKTEGDWQPVAGNLRVLLVNPRDQVVLDRPVRAGSMGTFHTDWTAPPTATQGMYRVRVVHASDTGAVNRYTWDPGDLARGSFRVDAFRRATFSVTARPSTPAYVSGDIFEGTVTGRYLFGADMTGQPVRYSVIRTPGYYTPPGFEGYYFGSYSDLEESYETRQVLVESDTVLGRGGQVFRRLPLATSTNGTPATLLFDATVTDPARQEISARTEITLHPGLFYVGLKPRSTFVDLGRTKSLAVDVVTIDPAGRPVGDQEIDLELVRQQWNSVREVGTDGRLRWRSERTENVLGRQHLRSREGVAKRVTLPVELGGSYVVRARARDVRGNEIRSETYFYAAGEGYVAWERSDDDRIDLVTDKQSYRPGETARILVQSPYEETTALVTIEREGVLSSSVMTLRGSAPMITVPLSERHLPNAFISVVLLKGRTASPNAGTDAGVPGFKIGYATLKVDPEQRHLKVDVRPNTNQLGPGETITVDLALTDAQGRGVPGEITFSAADAGVLNLVGYALPDPFDAFYGVRPLAVTTTESRANLIEQRSFGQKEEELGGGGGDAGYMLRKDFRPLAHWAPAIRTDSRGRARVRFRMPESLTTFRLMASAVAGGNRFGRGQADVVVTQPLVLQPALPRFVRPGDTFEAGVLVSNLTGTAGDATLTAQAQGVRLAGGATQRIRLGAGETREVRFQWSAPAQATTRVQFQAQLGRARDAFTFSIPVLPASTRQVSATFSSTTESTRESIQLPAGRVPGSGRVEVRLASTAMVGLDGAAKYLFEYPYGCLEQRTSAIRPFLIATDLIQAFKIPVPGGDPRKVVEAWIRDLPEFWLGNAFSMWAGQRMPNPYVSAYVVLALAEARDAGYAVPQDLARGAVDALAAHVRNRSERPQYYTSTAWDDTRALMLYALARHGRILEDEIRTLASSGTTSVEGAAYLLRAAVLAPALNDVRSALLDRVRRSIRVEATTAYMDPDRNAGLEWVFSTTNRATGLGVAALIEAAPDVDTRELTQRMVRYLMQQRGRGHWATTQENAIVLDALRAYYRAYESGDTQFTASVVMAGRSILNETFRGKSLRVATASQALPSGSGVLPVDLRLSGRGMLYYSLLVESYSTAPQRAETHGLSVARTVRRLSRTGQPVGAAIPSGSLRLAAGELVEVTLRLSTPADRAFVVLDDALPAGLEALNTELQTTDARLMEDVRMRADRDGRRMTYAFNHTEIRDDRVVAFADYLPRGEHTFTYLARATTSGRFVHPPARAEMMYQPETNGQTATGVLVVTQP